MADVHLRSEPGLANAPQPGLVGRGDNDAAHMMQQERETDIKKPPNESEGTEKHMSSGEGAGGLAGTEGPEAATPPEAIVEDPVANADAAAGLAALAAPLPCGQHIPQFDGEGDDEPEAGAPASQEFNEDEGDGGQYCGATQAFGIDEEEEEEEPRSGADLAAKWCRCGRRRGAARRRRGQRAGARA